MSATDVTLGLIIAIPAMLGFFWLWLKPCAILFAKGRTILGIMAIFMFGVSWFIALGARDKEAERQLRYAVWEAQTRQVTLLQLLVDQDAGASGGE